jgi:hypothetical protein
VLDADPEFTAWKGVDWLDDARPSATPAQPERKIAVGEHALSPYGAMVTQISTCAQVEDYVGLRLAFFSFISVSVAAPTLMMASRQLLRAGPRRFGVVLSTFQRCPPNRQAPTLPCALVPLGRKEYYQVSRFPETATASLGVLQRWFLPSSRLFSPRNQAAMITFSRSAPLATLLQRVREQYREMPGLKLTKPQATRLFGVAPSVCAAMLRALVMENFLSRTGEGVFVRSTTH